jgi:hypothetical protein
MATEFILSYAYPHIPLSKALAKSPIKTSMVIPSPKIKHLIVWSEKRCKSPMKTWFWALFLIIRREGLHIPF